MASIVSISIIACSSWNFLSIKAFFRRVQLQILLNTYFHLFLDSCSLFNILFSLFFLIVFKELFSLHLQDINFILKFLFFVFKFIDLRIQCVACCFNLKLFSLYGLFLRFRWLILWLCIRFGFIAATKKFIKKRHPYIINIICLKKLLIILMKYFNVGR